MSVELEYQLNWRIFTLKKIFLYYLFCCEKKCYKKSDFLSGCYIYRPLLFLIICRITNINIWSDFRRRQEAEKSESYETWLANKETEKKTVTLQPILGPRPPELEIPDRPHDAPGVRHEGYLRSYLRSLDERKKANSFFCFEDWLNQKEETVLGIRHKKHTTFAS